MEPDHEVPSDDDDEYVLLNDSKSDHDDDSNNNERESSRRRAESRNDDDDNDNCSKIHKDEQGKNIAVQVGLRLLILWTIAHLNPFGVAILPSTPVVVAEETNVKNDIKYEMMRQRCVLDGGGIHQTTGTLTLVMKLRLSGTIEGTNECFGDHFLHGGFKNNEKETSTTTTITDADQQQVLSTRGIISPTFIDKSWQVADAWMNRYAEQIFITIGNFQHARFGDGRDDEAMKRYRLERSMRVLGLRRIQQQPPEKGIGDTTALLYGIDFKYHESSSELPTHTVLERLQQEVRIGSDTWGSSGFGDIPSHFIQFEWRRRALGDANDGLALHVNFADPEAFVIDKFGMRVPRKRQQQERRSWKPPTESYVFHIGRFVLYSKKRAARTSFCSCNYAL